ncbi:MAG: FecR domain-containing protein [candidate division KSB1 bacterium]|nr:FecR domain-containing protein [candidate division KSB1 bacterium]MDZ7288148.1 FecR domain-containing protein [candidate division KSB1 bacterium]MDZ7300339.1 FecR domain-containing protein [candidate division KSB1 bacterium]MDZ7306152.1 FecR domain-containing protein [candidate division KSB1 bacterium]MDZ7351339.1 FecR domain-containing protein [candidate division KSB1 bacterium]
MNQRATLPVFACLALLWPGSPGRHAPLQQSAKQVIARRGDTLSFLALRYYGFFNDSLQAVLAAANPAKNLNELQAGDTLTFPPRPGNQALPEVLQSAAAGAVLTYLEGEVSCRRPQYSPAFVAARPNLVLRSGDEIKTGKNGRAELVLDNRSVLRLDANSHLRIAALQHAGTYQARFAFAVGSLWTRITKLLQQKPQIEVEFPTAIAGVQGTTYRTVVAPDSATTVRVYDGAVEVRNSPAAGRRGPPQRIGPPQQVPGPAQVSLDTWIKLVRAYQEIHIAKNGRPSDPRAFRDQGAELDWVHWNQQRDRELDTEP